jgi:hypothetical protein
MKKIILLLLLVISLVYADKKDIGINAFAGAALYGTCIWIDRTWDIEYLDDRVCYLFPVAYTVGIATVGDQGNDALGALIVPTPLFIYSIYEWGNK